MVLVQVFAAVRKDQVRRDALGQAGEELFDLEARVGETGVPEREHLHVPGSGGVKKPLGAGRGFVGPRARAAEDDPVNGHARVQRQQLQQRAAAADLDIVGVCAETEDRSQGSE